MVEFARGRSNTLRSPESVLASVHAPLLIDLDDG
jgi:hypothetical protein